MHPLSVSFTRAIIYAVYSEDHRVNTACNACTHANVICLSHSCFFSSLLFPRSLWHGLRGIREIEREKEKIEIDRKWGCGVKRGEGGGGEADSRTLRTIK